jgi:hypothetical protein
LGADDGEEGYVCECCDPAKKKKGSESSEDNSEIDQDESLEPEVRNLCHYLHLVIPTTSVVEPEHFSGAAFFVAVLTPGR